jgi:hypothetical protein
MFEAQNIRPLFTMCADPAAQRFSKAFVSMTAANGKHKVSFFFFSHCFHWFSLAVIPLS